MNAYLSKWIDLVVIRAAAARMPKATGLNAGLEEARALLQRPDFFLASEKSPGDFEFTGDAFRFASSVDTPWKENNTVVGRLYRSGEGEDWRRRPAAILLHGWNDELGYRIRHPIMARRLNRLGINALTVELPYHFHRRPAPGAGAVRNFFSRDTFRSVQAVQQSVADIRAVRSWLNSQGCEKVGVCGVSLGGWLSGLMACFDPKLHCALLTTPAACPERMVQELSFCATVRKGFEAMGSECKRFNLAEHRPRMAPENILLVEAENDRFVAKETIEELWHAWGRPEIWRLPHGHISILASFSVQSRTVRWMAQKLGPARP